MPGVQQEWLHEPCREQYGGQTISNVATRISVASDASAIRSGAARRHAIHEIGNSSSAQYGSVNIVTPIATQAKRHQARDPEASNRVRANSVSVDHSENIA